MSTSGTYHSLRAYRRHAWWLSRALILAAVTGGAYLAAWLATP
jgi:hypothetical protein